MPSKFIVTFFILLQIIWFTALFPYFVMSILFFRAITLEGASIGLIHYITPNWDKFLDSETWIDSATQVEMQQYDILKFPSSAISFLFSRYSLPIPLELVPCQHWVLITNSTMIVLSKAFIFWYI